MYYAAFWGTMGVFAPFINIYFAGLGLSGTQIGLLSTLVPAMTLTVGPALSALADRRAQRRRILQFAIAGGGLAILLESIPDSFEVLGAAVMLVAFFFSPVISIADSLISRMATRYQLDFGKVRMWGSIGFASMVVVCGWLWEQVGLRWMFVLAALLFILIFVMAGQLEEGPPADRQRRQSFKELLRDPGLAAILATSFLAGAGNQIYFTFGSVYINTLGSGLFFIGVISALSASLEVPAMRYSSAAVERFGGPKTLLIAYILLGVSLLCYGLTSNLPVLLVASLVRGIGSGLFVVSTVRLIDSRVPQEWSSTAQSMMYAASMGLAPLLASPVAGWVYDTLGSVTLFIGGSVLVGLAGIAITVAAARGWLEGMR
ncbi:MAG: MFS transporter [Anaerolineae bacterium]|nr:MFS transporter [Anaerolineae bacterium]